jgi:tetratricopeptide (TPR) repeat protein
MTRIAVLAAVGLLLLWASEPAARGPRGGGGARPAMARPAAAPQVTPAFSRPATARPAPVQQPAAARPGFVPSGPTVHNFDRPASTTRPAVQRPGGISPPQTPAVARPLPRPGTGPGPVVRPGSDGIQRPNPAIFNRPDGIRPDRPDRPDRANIINNRPIDITNRQTNIVNRPNLNVGNRSINTNINNVNRWNQYNRVGNNTRPAWNRPANWNRPWYGNRPAWYWGRPWYNNHWGWHHGYWNYWTAPPALWFGGGAAAGWLLSPGDTFVYSNPYYVVPQSTTIVVPPALDYSVAIPVPTADQAALAYPPPPDEEALDAGDPLPTTAPPAPETEDDDVTAANAKFDAARVAFKEGDYARAQRLVEEAIERLPSDATLHEFRALTLFAQQRYRDAAAALYAVMAAGPGWDWQTLSALYPDTATYTRQLRALEEYLRKHPDDGAAHFVLAYHYLVLGSKDEAVKQLEKAVRAEPQDKLSAALLKALTSDATAQGAVAPRPGEGQ